ncbi:hypothetical protein D623_10003208 [Myotis brandtii]|uniref:Uncharacterized protein n=1 Tax=Myotis brandtii TaxID=109478 RepID=S7PIT0_MYOBR|nr:hypothetical protein D623_10003208 [Myotis brandtii]
MSFSWLPAPPGPAPAPNTWLSAPGESEERASTGDHCHGCKACGSRSQGEVLNAERGILQGPQRFPLQYQCTPAPQDLQFWVKFFRYTFRFSESQARCQKEFPPGSLLPVMPQVLLSLLILH